MPDKFEIRTVDSYLRLAKDVALMNFRSMDSETQHSISFARQLTFDQVVDCLGKVLECEANRILLFRPSDFGPAISPISMTGYPNFGAIREMTDVLFYEISDLPVNVAARFDVTVLEEDLKFARAPHYLRRPCLVSDLEAKLDDKINGRKHKFFYLDGIVPIPFRADEMELSGNLSRRIVCQIGDLEIRNEVQEMLFAVLYSDPDLLYSTVLDDIPHFIRVKRPILWKEVKEIIGKEEVLELVNRKRTGLEACNAQDNYVIDGEKGEMAVVVRKINIRVPAVHAPMHMKKVALRKEDIECEEEEEEVFEEEEEEEAQEEPNGDSGL
jgi:hypothetical protein